MAWKPKKPILYVTRDIERALGTEPTAFYQIVTNDSEFGRIMQSKYPLYIHLVSKEIKDSYDLLLLKETQDLIARTHAYIVVFQNTPRIERLAREKNWNLINPSADLAKIVEEKISQITWLGDDAQLLPAHNVSLVKDVVFSGTPFVLQFNHSHTGQGTHIIKTGEALTELQKLFPLRDCRVVDFISGPVFTVNVSVGKIWTTVGTPSYQITGIEPFTDIPFSTIGNDWSLPTPTDQKAIHTIARRIAKRMRKSGWKGLCGLDIIYDEKNDRYHLLEINARQAASVTYESQLQRKSCVEKTLFECHLDDLCGSYGTFYKVRPITGAQIVSRVTKTPHTIDIERLKNMGLQVISYTNTEHNKELLRIQTPKGIMEVHNRFNALGKDISSCIL